MKLGEIRGNLRGNRENIGGNLREIGGKSALKQGKLGRKRKTKREKEGKGDNLNREF